MTTVFAVSAGARKTLVALGSGLVSSGIGTGGLKVMLVALVVVQLMVSAWPERIVAGEAVSETVGFCALTVMVRGVAVAVVPFAPCAVRWNVVVAARLGTVNDPFGGCLPTPLSIMTCVALAVTQLRVTGLLGAMVLELELNETTCGPLGEGFVCGGGEAPSPRQPVIVSRQLNSREAIAIVDLRRQSRVIRSFPKRAGAWFPSLRMAI